MTGVTTYLVLTVVVLAIVAAACLPVLRRLPPAPILATGAVLLVLTAVFDSAIVGYGLTVYDPATILGVYVGAAPVEDFGYTIAALLLMPTLWTWLGRGRAASEQQSPSARQARGSAWGRAGR